MTLSGELYRQLNDALISAFPQEADLDQMVRFGLSQNRPAIAGGSNLTQIIFNLIGWAEARDMTSALVIAARNSNPSNAKLRKVAELLEVAPDSGELERIITASVEFSDVAQWRSKMSKSELPVCRVEIPDGTGIGTGFLVGPGVAITNYHVMEDVVTDWLGHGGGDKWRTVTLRFDYKMTEDGRTLHKGESFQLSDDWLIDSSPVEELDYVFMRVKGDPGIKPVGNQVDAPQRGWLTPIVHKFELGEPLLIIQHPSAKPLKLSVGVVNDFQKVERRIIYTANTLPGSSGSPCFTSDWNLVALHHFGTAAGNRGIVFTEIIDQLERKGLLDFILKPASTRPTKAESATTDDTLSSDVTVQGGFYQPGWKIQGDVLQAAGDIVLDNNIREEPDNDPKKEGK